MADAMMQQARPLSGCAGAGAVVVPSMADAMMQQARPLSGCAGAGSSPKLARGRSFHGRRDDAAGAPVELLC